MTISLVEAGPALTELQRERYQRNIDVPGIGELGQRRLLNARVLVVGAGGLGSAVLPYLTAAGIGAITIADGDAVELKNMQRQVLHHELGHNKALSAVERLRLLNPDVTFEAITTMLDPQACDELFVRHDLVVDCTDTFAAKYVLSDAAQRTGVPLVWATAVSTQGQCSVFGIASERTEPIHLRDLVPEEPAPEDYPRAVELGVLGSVVGQVGTAQATEVIKLVTGWGDPLIGRLLLIDGARSRYDVIEVRVGR
ncbi:HesA/MoeB/ThiF family protein [Aestuariimicrobium ganziense]|uniref:HesA/MoeB/ThiF family protein n=1 Tax=Aestuariimicrobium ganziense TaxID=2773677 RepID=UPI00194495EA|nr:HesA/MoeB/ThiF family protein [Aestuariimicrobium ganziense]